LQKLRYILFPFTLIYHWVTTLRNHLYNIEYKKSIEFDRLTIGVGNLRVGGTGKTPISIYIIKELINNGIAASYLSRGYGRKTKGFFLVDENDTSKKVGDEALLIKKTFPSIPVAVCEERVIGIPFLIAENPHIEAIVLDDVYQHRSIRPHLNILLTAYHDLFTNDYVLPIGMLREARRGANRADLIIVTKCPDFKSIDKEFIKKDIQSYSNPETPILFSTIQYKEAECVVGRADLSKEIVLLSAIADNQNFAEHFENHFEVRKHFKFSDHHNFSSGEIKEIVNFMRSNECSSLVTTEKDWQRLITYQAIVEENQISVWVVAIEVVLDQADTLWQKIIDAKSKV
jgi:tetraacyldisaccharide 4'-kinase